MLLVAWQSPMTTDALALSMMTNGYLDSLGDRGAATSLNGVTSGFNNIALHRPHPLSTAQTTSSSSPLPTPTKNIENIFEQNEQWIRSKLEDDPDFFNKLGSGHNPTYLWIGKFWFSLTPILTLDGYHF